MHLIVTHVSKQGDAKVAVASATREWVTGLVGLREALATTKPAT
ncbi:hypothetical protein [Rhizobium leguminosarum]|nr:hypothetical protein [Rhizobium leguminosarum]